MLPSDDAAAGLPRVFLVKAAAADHAREHDAVPVPSMPRRKQRNRQRLPSAGQVFKFAPALAAPDLAALRASMADVDRLLADIVFAQKLCASLDEIAARFGSLRG